MKNERLIEARKAAKLSQEDLTCIAGFKTLNSYRRFEIFNATPAAAVQERIGKALNLDPRELWADGLTDPREVAKR